MKPTLPRKAWHVFTNDAIHDSFSSQANWAWVAYGPRGTDSGVEETADAALNKAMLAAELLADPRVAEARA